MFYLLSKIAAHLCTEINVDSEGMDQVKKLSKSQRRNRIVFIPMYKSFADPLILHYINYFFDLELGFSFGNYEDKPKIHFVDNLLKGIGVLLIKRKE